MIIWFYHYETKTLLRLLTGIHYYYMHILEIAIKALNYLDWPFYMEMLNRAIVKNISA